MDANTDVFAATEARLGRDNFAMSLGISLIAAEPGRVSVGMTVTEQHLNFFGWGHGGLTFALADTAFGLASNSREHQSVGIDAHAAYLSGVREGDALIAMAEEISRTTRKAVYRVDVTKAADNAGVLSFTGTVFVTDRPNV